MHDQSRSGAEINQKTNDVFGQRDQVQVRASRRRLQDESVRCFSAQGRFPSVVSSFDIGRPNV